MDFRDYYQVLGVERSASEADIRQAYRRLARKFHPDVSKEADAAARMIEINEANSVLSDPERRKAYDTLGNRYGAGDTFQAPPDWQGTYSERARRGHAAPGGHGAFGEGFANSDGQGFSGFDPRAADGETDYSEFFSSLFGRRGARAASSAAGAEGEAFRFDGQDHHAAVEVTIPEAYHGGERTLQLQDGEGQIRTLVVKIPKGVRHGQHIRLAGQGMPGFNGGKDGDLYLEIRLVSEPDLRCDGLDVYQRLAVTPWEAALGATIEAETVAGTIAITVPQNSQSGRKLRLRGKGLQPTQSGRSASAQNAGDLYLELAVVLPPADTDVARQLYQQMAHDLPFNPRGGHARAAASGN